MKKNIFKYGFTLAEAMIVMVLLGIIGSICIMVVNPVNVQKEGYATTAEKMINVITQTSTEILINHASLDNMTRLNDNKGGYISIANTSDITRFVDLYKKYMALNAKSPDLSDPYFASSKKILDYSGAATAVDLNSYSNFFYLQDGVLLGYKLYGSCSSTETIAVAPHKTTTSSINGICGSIYIDVNGVKKPNKLGTDQYIFPLDERGLIKFTN